MAPKRPGLEEALALVRAVDPGSAAGRTALEKALGDARGAVVAAAAEILAEAELKDFVPALVLAFERLMLDAAKADPGCKGKTAILHTLLKFDAEEKELYVRGVRHRQMEPVWKGSVDTAPELRGLSAVGLLRTRHPRGPLFLAELLADVEPCCATIPRGPTHPDVQSRSSP